jgi:hypothetical protein
MDPQRWAKIESLYHAALAKEPGEWSGYLAADPPRTGWRRLSQYETQEAS